MTILTNKVISVFDKKTSMRLTKIEWEILDSICMRENIKRKKLLELIEARRNSSLGLTPSVRLFALLYLYSLNGKFTGYYSSHKSPHLENTLKQIEH